MAKPSELQHESTKIAHQAELGRPSDLQQVHRELQTDMKHYSASDYGKLLNGIQHQNDADVKANSHLPNLDLVDSSKSGVADSINAKYSDGSLMTAKGQVAPTSGSTLDASVPQPGSPIPGGHSSLDNVGGSSTGGSPGVLKGPNLEVPAPPHGVSSTPGRSGLGGG